MTAPIAPSPFPVVRPCDLQVVATSSTPWLIDQLWTTQAVGIIGGNSQGCYKTWMALENGHVGGFRFGVPGPFRCPITRSCPPLCR